MQRLFCLLCCLIVLTGCESEIGTIDLSKNHTGAIQLHLEKNEELQIWTRMDIEYKELPLMVYDFRFMQGDQTLINGGNDPLAAEPKKDEVKKQIEGINQWSFYGKLEGTFIAPKDTIFTIQTALIKNNSPELKINQAEIVFVK